jgi:DNA-directed RNA polymerase subunit RPC12/RpoP
MRTTAARTPFSYADTAVPTDYKCGTCGATNCKLWREYQTFGPSLKCADCAAKEGGKDISDIDENGARSSDCGMTDQIGWYVPAIPDLEGDGWWGTTVVPGEGYEWWRKLPTKPAVQTAKPA